MGSSSGTASSFRSNMVESGLDHNKGISCGCKHRHNTIIPATDIIQQIPLYILSETQNRNIRGSHRSLCTAT
uniref:Uncharacterized protein n=1 Tax=Arundo donax TaxID=35708 RepID=A0A0A9D2C6_ARUDO